LGAVGRWFQRTNFWREITSPALGPERPRSDEALPAVTLDGGTGCRQRRRSSPAKHMIERWKPRAKNKRRYIVDKPLPQTNVNNIKLAINDLKGARDCLRFAAPMAVPANAGMWCQTIGPNIYCYPL